MGAWGGWATEARTTHRGVQSRRGLTLVELIVVIAIILILACLLLWALAKVRAAVQSLGNPPEQKQPEPPAPTTPPPA